jgi:hypothetical protein
MCRVTRTVVVLLAVTVLILCASSLQATIIPGVTASVSSQCNAGGPDVNGGANKLTDGYYTLDAYDPTHSGSYWNYGWYGRAMTGATGLNEWVKLDLDGSYLLDTLTVYNCNDPACVSTRGVKQVDIYVSSVANPGNPVDNPGNWTSVYSDQTLTFAPGSDTSYPSPDQFSLAGHTANAVAIKIDSIGGLDPYGSYIAGLSELTISGTAAPTPEPSSLLLLATGLIGLLCYAWRRRK